MHIRRVSESRSSIGCDGCGQYLYTLGGSKTFACGNPECERHDVPYHRDEKAARLTMVHNWADSVRAKTITVLRRPQPAPQDDHHDARALGQQDAAPAGGGRRVAV